MASNVPELTLEHVIATLQNFIITPEKTIKFANKAFLKILIAEYLNVQIDKLNIRQRTYVYNFLLKKIRHYKEKYKNNSKSMINIKEYLTRKLTTEIQLLEHKPKILENVKSEEDNDDLIFVDSTDDSVDVPTKIGATKESTVTSLTQPSTSKIVSSLGKNIDSEAKVTSTTSAKGTTSRPESPSSTQSKSRILRGRSASLVPKIILERINDRRASVSVEQMVKEFRNETTFKTSLPQRKQPKVYSSTVKTKVHAKPNSANQQNITPRVVIKLNQLGQENRTDVTREKSTNKSTNSVQVSSTSKEPEPPQISLKELSKDPKPSTSNLSNGNALRLSLLNDWSLEEPEEDQSKDLDDSDQLHIDENQNTADMTNGSNNSNVEIEDLNNTTELPVASTSGIKNTKPKQRRKSTTTKQKRLTNVPRYNLNEFLSVKFRKSHHLEIHASPYQMYNHYYELNPNTFELTMGMAASYPVNKDHIPDIHDLLYWPEVEFKVSLPDIEISRKCVGNKMYELVKPDAYTVFANKNKNKTNVQRFYVNKTMELIHPVDKDVELSLGMIELYLELVIKCLSVADFNKKKELEVVLKAMLQDLQLLRRIYMKVSYSYFLSAYKYYRVFTQDLVMNPKNELLVLRETFNPEIIYTVNRCNYEEEKGEINGNNLTEFFHKILIEKNEKAINDFISMLNKGYSVSCLACMNDSASFPGSLKLTLVNEHIKNYCLEELHCINCNFKADMKLLAKEKWSHECVAE